MGSIFCTSLNDYLVLCHTLQAVVWWGRAETVIVFPQLRADDPFTSGQRKLPHRVQWGPSTKLMIPWADRRDCGLCLPWIESQLRAVSVFGFCKSDWNYSYMGSTANARYACWKPDLRVFCSHWQKTQWNVWMRNKSAMWTHHERNRVGPNCASERLTWVLKWLNLP